MMRHRALAVSQLRPYIERARGFSGWTFTDVNVRHLDPRAPWDYVAIARDHASRARSIVDLGTGGGERFAEITAGLNARLVATEEWDVNVRVATDRLRPLGIDVLGADSTRLPFRDASFDLVLDRHEALDPAECARVATSGGFVITQQVGHDEWPELRRFFPRKTTFPDHFHEYQRGFVAAGLVIDDARWHQERVAFATLGDLVYMLLTAPWYVGDLDPVAEIDTLLALDDALRTDDGIVLTEMHYIIVASKPA